MIGPAFTLRYIPAREDLNPIADKASIIWMSRDWRRIGKSQQPEP